MTHTVEIQPSGHSFKVEPGETLLEAALRSGINLKYSCSNGTCGDCRARVISGSLGDRLHHDYVLSNSEKMNGTVLLCRCTSASDLIIESSEITSAEDIPLQEIKTTVCKLEQITPDIMVLNLRTPRTKTLQFLSGQHVKLIIDGVPARFKSIASCPCNGMFLQFHIRKVTDDPFSNHIFSKLSQRQSVFVQGPYGKFTFNDDSTHPILFIAYETGFAPIKSLIEHAISLELAQPIRLYWIARHDKDHYYSNYCRAWQDTLDDFQYIPITINANVDDLERFHSGEPVDWQTLSELEEEWVRGLSQIISDVPDLRNVDVYANGPEAFKAVLAELLSNYHLPSEQLYWDDIQKFKIE